MWYENYIYEIADVIGINNSSSIINGIKGHEDKASLVVIVSLWWKVDEKIDEINKEFETYHCKLEAFEKEKGELLSDKRATKKRLSTKGADIKNLAEGKSCRWNCWEMATFLREGNC